MINASTRRGVLAAASRLAAAASTVSLLARTGSAQAQPAASPTPAAAGPFVLEPLPYSYAALEPYIDAQTMQLHHDKHHGTYVNNLNEAAKAHPNVAARPPEQVLADLGTLPEDVRTTVRNNLGGHVNHTMFWQVMGPGGGQLDGELKAAILRDFGGLQPLQERFNTAGTKVFGSGWVFVTVSQDGRLAMETRPNQDSPLMDGRRALFGGDVWEHAYYLKYQNRRADYLKAWWSVVNWRSVSDRYAKARQGLLQI